MSDRKPENGFWAGSLTSSFNSPLDGEAGAGSLELEEGVADVGMVS